jgi:hypothetical protein
MESPMEKFTQWWEAALVQSPLNQKSAVCVSTVGQDGMPSGRFVDLKGADEDGFTFCTYLDSAKGAEIRENPNVALTIWWDPVGYQGVQIGTAFLACEESNAGETHRSKLFSREAGDTSLTRVFSGRLARGIRNRLMFELDMHPADVVQYPVQNWLSGQLKQAALQQGRDDLMSLWCGQSARLLKHRSVPELMAALIDQTSKRMACPFDNEVERSWGETPEAG